MQDADDREERLVAYVTANSSPGDATGAMACIDTFGWEQSFLMNVGDQKGEILDAAVQRVGARRILELGTYCGYSSLRMAIAAPDAAIFSVDPNERHISIARRIHAHAGVADRIQIVQGMLGDDGETVATLEREHGLGPSGLDLVFIDHAKDAYLPDLETILARGWLREGGLAVADNIGYPGAPAYRAAIEAQEGVRWRTEVHATVLEYHTDRDDIVLVSELLAA